VAGYEPKWFTHPQIVTHPSTNRARHRVVTRWSIIENRVSISQIFNSKCLI